jgi:hypothetical protein
MLLTNVDSTERILMRYNNAKKYKVINAKINKKLIGDELDLKLITPKKPKPPVEPVPPTEPIGPDDGLDVTGDPERGEHPRPPKPPKPTLATVIEMIAAMQNTLNDHSKRFDKINDRLDKQDSFNNEIRTFMKTTDKRFDKIEATLERHDAMFREHG